MRQAKAFPFFLLLFPFPLTFPFTITFHVFEDCYHIPLQPPFLQAEQTWSSQSFITDCALETSDHFYCIQVDHSSKK